MIYVAGITSLTGGGSTDFHNYSTLLRSAGYAVEFYETISGFRRYRLFAGDGTSADDENSPIQIKPSDYNASTNCKIWILG